MAAEAKPEKKECTVGKIIQRWVRAKREECLDIVDRNEEDFREKVRNALDELYKAHKIPRLKIGIQDIQYEDPFFQFGYIYKHSMFSARSLSTVMHRSNVLKNLEMQNNKLTVACLGGGPGTDVLGVLDYFTGYMGDFEGRLKIRLYDREDKWGSSWESLKTAIKAKLRDRRVRVRCHDFDVTKADKNKPDVKKADVITMHYFMEEVYSERGKAQVVKCFKYIIQNAKQGALFLYSGMFMEQVIDWVHQLFLKYNCELLTPDTEQPEPDTEQPGQPDMEQPGQPDTEQPEPDTEQPGQPDMEQPGQPDMEQPGQPDMEQPEPDTEQPGQPDMEQPGQPDMEQPGQPDMEQPEPDTEQPGQPDMAQPGQPDMAQPGQPDMAQPGQPDMAQPGQPDMAQPGQPDMAQPGQPDMEQPGQLDTEQPGQSQRSYKDTSTGTEIEKWIPYAEVNLKNQKDLKLFDDIRADLEKRYETKEVSQRYRGELVYRLYQKQ
ncbi:uncharacterized protein LOC144926495 [Branchiostoma floridae x Branchiostoma belcheri]